MFLHHITDLLSKRSTRIGTLIVKINLLSIIMISHRQYYYNNSKSNDDSSFEDDDDILDDCEIEQVNICSRSIVSEQINTSDYDDDLYWDADLEDSPGGRRVDSNRFPRPWIRRRDRNTIRSLLTYYNRGTSNSIANNNSGDNDDDDDNCNIVPEITYTAPTTANVTRRTQHSNELSRKRKRSSVDNCLF